MMATVIRAIVVILGAAMIIGGLMMPPPGSGVALVVFGALIALSVLFEQRYRRNGSACPPAGDEWQPTGESFRDAENGAIVTVWHNALSGERRYVSGQSAGK